MNPQGLERLVPGPVMHRLGVRQHAVKIEQQRVELQNRTLRIVIRRLIAIIVS
jgi:hypothetical protein